MPIDEHGTLTVPCDQTIGDVADFSTCAQGMFINITCQDVQGVASAEDLFANILIGEQKVTEIRDFLTIYLNQRGIQ